MNFQACRWPVEYGPPEVTHHFTALDAPAASARGTAITLSHFVPRIDVMPYFISAERLPVCPVLGAAALDAQVRAANSSLHVHGHSHINRRADIDGMTHLNNTPSYPKETRIAAIRLLCVFEH
ncbi:MAG: hypothetical protein JNN30_13670 [Rhodanobacteraceae bacterium]|nr:hypothetical protein [Rhodanobacteraceae bacterium]